MFLLAAVFSGPVAQAGETARALDGNRLLVSGVEHRLYGIAAPEPGDTCRLGSKALDCGVIARAALTDLTVAARIVCHPAASFPGTSVCRADGYDLSEGMVYTGWAKPRPDAPAHLHRLLAEARAAGRGMWRRLTRP